MTSRQYGKRAIFVSGDVRFEDGDVVDLDKLGGGALSPVFCFLSVYALAPRVYVSSYTSIGLPCYYGTGACATYAYFLCTIHVNVCGI